MPKLEKHAVKNSFHNVMKFWRKMQTQKSKSKAQEKFSKVQNHRIPLNSWDVSKNYDKPPIMAIIFINYNANLKIKPGF